MISGAEVRSDLLKKSGTGAKYLVREPPSPRAMLSRWLRLFGPALAPSEFLAAASAEIQGFVHRDRLLLFGADRIIYDTKIVHEGQAAGELTIFFLVETEPGPGWLGFLRTREVKVVYIDTIALREQSKGYASALFARYEKIFHDMGFHEFRLKASLSVGKYYWAKEGFDCLDPDDVRRMREKLSALVAGRSLPVAPREIRRLNHAYDFALFRRDLEIPVYRNAEGYYSLARTEAFDEEVRFPLGKAFLLSHDPWDGHKVIYTNTPRRTGFVHSAEYLEHRTRPGHVESPKRLVALLSAVDKAKMRSSLVFLQPYSPDIEFVERVHDREYVEAFRACVESGQKEFATRDCSVSEKSFDVALLAAGGVMAGIDAVMNRRVENAFCAVRPPGHHAGRGRAMGFCFLNNVAVGATYARVAYGLERIFILDWDVHHGNGTQEIFEEDPLTYVCSLHEHPTFCYPGTGRRIERGRGAGSGTTLNVPLRPHADDREVIDLFETEVVPAMEGFRPDLFLLSAGFDGHRDDPIADIDLTEASFTHMTRRVCELADRLCGGRVVSVMEGGYNPLTFASSALAHIRALQGRS